jgi:heptosyltransferase II
VLAWMTGLPVSRWQAGTLDRRLRVLKLKSIDLPPVAQRYAAAAAQCLAQEVQTTLPHLQADAASMLWAQQWLSQHDNDARPWLAVAPGAAWATKRWSMDHFATTLNAISKAKVLLVGSAQERALCEELQMKLTVKATMAAGATPDGRHLLALLSQCSAFLGHDSGPMHLAEALKIPCTVLFGPTVQGFGFYPQGAGHQVFERDLNCRPCSVHGSEACPLGHHHCMQWIDPAEVARHLNLVLAI